MAAHARNITIINHVNLNINLGRLSWLLVMLDRESTGHENYTPANVNWSLTHWGSDKMDAISQDDMFKCIHKKKNVWIPIEISLKFVPKGPINNIPALVQIMAWRRSGDKPLSEPMMVRLPTHKYITRPQWVNILTA